MEYFKKYFMISRRLIRIKAFKVLFSAVCSDSKTLEAAQKELLNSCEKTKELYYFLLNIAPSLVNVASDRIDAGLRKFHPTEEQAHPNYKFVNNRFVKLLNDDPAFGSFCQKRSLVWGEYDVFVRKVYNSIVASDYYQEYMNSGNDSFEEDCRLFSRIYEEEFEDNEKLEEILEDMSLYWIDDLEYTLNVILKNIDTVISKKAIVHPNTFMKEDDKEFAVTLLSEAMTHHDEYMRLVSENASNWKSDRIVLTDAVIIVLGLAEAVCFSNIPIKVTINEYVDLSKFYSTPNSRVFVNGVLDKLIQQKVSSGEIVKVGRGLKE